MGSARKPTRPVKVVNQCSSYRILLVELVDAREKGLRALDGGAIEHALHADHEVRRELVVAAELPAADKAALA